MWRDALFPFFYFFFFFLSGELIDDTCMRTRRQRSQSNVIKSVIESVISVSAREFYYTRGTISLPQSFAARIFLFCLHFSFPRFSKEHPELRVHSHTLKRECNVTDQNNVEISKREWWRDSKKIIEITSLIYRFIINLVLFCKYTCFSLFFFFFFTKIIYRLFAFWYREFDMRSIVVFSTRSLLRFIIINHLLRLPFKSVSLFDNCYRQSISDLLRSY